MPLLQRMLTLGMLAISLLSGCSGHTVHRSLLTSEEIDRCLKDQFYVARGVVHFEGGDCPYEVSITSKGNGTLFIGPYQVGIYDDHADEDLFEPRLLDVVEVVNHNGKCVRLELTGTQLILDEFDDRVLSVRPISVRCIADSSGGVEVLGDEHGIARYAPDR